MSILRGRLFPGMLATPLSPVHVLCPFYLTSVFFILSPCLGVVFRSAWLVHRTSRRPLPHRDAHVRAVHRAQLPHQCSYCTVSFHHADTLERHQRWHRLRGRSQGECEEGEEAVVEPPPPKE